MLMYIVVWCLQGKLALLGCNSCFMSVDDVGDVMCENKTATDSEIIQVLLLSLNPSFNIQPVFSSY